MPDPIQFLKAMLVAAIAAGVTLFLAALPRRLGVVEERPAAALARLGWVLGVGLGAALGSWMLDLRPGWPPREDLDRLLVLILPAAIIVEAIAAVVATPWWPAWSLRFVLIALAGRVLLHGSSYLTDPAGPGSREWAATQAVRALAGLAAMLAAVWLALYLLQKRSQSRSIPLAISMTLAAAGLAVMLTGYLSGGELGLALCAALAGAVAASCLFSFQDGTGSSIGVGVIGLFCLVMVGRFFGGLSTAYALILFLAPLLCWLPELLLIRRLRPWAAGIVRLILVSIPLALVLVQVQGESVKGAGEPAGENEPTLQDYMNFGR
jgi:hypothetical protein